MTNGDEREDPDGLEGIFERVREPSPPGLEERLLAGLADPLVARRYESADRADLIARAVRFSLVAFFLAAVVLALVLTLDRARTPEPSSPPTPTKVPDTPVDEALLAFSKPLELETGASYWPLEAK